MMTAGLLPELFGPVSTQTTGKEKRKKTARRGEEKNALLIAHHIIIIFFPTDRSPTPEEEKKKFYSFLFFYFLFFRLILTAVIERSRATINSATAESLLYLLYRPSSLRLIFILFFHMAQFLFHKIILGFYFI
jgi:hypothetical protein